MANDFEIRLKSLEDREAIFYEFIDKLRQYHEDSLKRFEQNENRIEQNENRIEQNEEGLRVERERIDQNEQRIDQNERMIVALTVKLDDFGETQKLMLRILDRMGESLNDLSRPGKNGNA